MNNPTTEHPDERPSACPHALTSSLLSVEKYREAALHARREDMQAASRCLDAAYLLRPPQLLAQQEIEALFPFWDELVCIGQWLPSLSPTVDLLTRFRQLLLPPAPRRLA